MGLLFSLQPALLLQLAESPLEAEIYLRLAPSPSIFSFALFAKEATWGFNFRLDWTMHMFSTFFSIYVSAFGPCFQQSMKLHKHSSSPLAKECSLFITYKKYIVTNGGTEESKPISTLCSNNIQTNLLATWQTQV